MSKNINLVSKCVDIVLNKKNVKFHVFDYNHYKNLYTDQKFHDDSVGLDIISLCLENDKCWEPFQTELTKEILEEDKDGLFVDVGCQLGYYSVLSSLVGVQTLSIDFCNSFLTLFKKTIENNELTKIKIINETVDGNFDLLEHVSSNINLIKIDIEGAEHFLFSSIEPLLHGNKTKIKNIIMEISPNLDDSYSEICKKLHSYGYKIYDIGLSHQRKLKQNTNHIQNIESLRINIDNISEYIQNLEYRQSNFLFRL